MEKIGKTRSSHGLAVWMLHGNSMLLFSSANVYSFPGENVNHSQKRFFSVHLVIKNCIYSKGQSIPNTVHKALLVSPFHFSKPFSPEPTKQTTTKKVSFRMLRMFSFLFFSHLHICYERSVDSKDIT